MRDMKNREKSDIEKMRERLLDPESEEDKISRIVMEGIGGFKIGEKSSNSTE